MEEEEWRDDGGGKACGASEPIVSIPDCIVGGSELPISMSDSSSSSYSPNAQPPHVVGNNIGAERIAFSVFSFGTVKWNM
jgi:hypothetical protein